MGIKVSLRKKKISKGRASLYLDFYPQIIHSATGKPTRREFLGIYIIDKPKNNYEKSHNSDSLSVAEGIRHRRQTEINMPDIYGEFEKEILRLKSIGEEDYVKYFYKKTQKKKGSNYNSWISTYNYLNAFTNGSLKFSEINESFLNDFKEYLQTTNNLRHNNKPLTQNSSSSYFNKIKSSLRDAFRDGKLKTDINRLVKSIPSKDGNRTYLTNEELVKLNNTHFDDEVLKRASIFSALTGLRYSDIQKLIWSEIFYEENAGYKIKYTSKKTKEDDYLPISNDAFNLLEERKNPKDKVFSGLIYSAHKNKQIKSWVKSAGIDKEITFHCFRHTFATILLSKGVSIYVISKLLLHKNIKTTAVYAKVIDKDKMEAVNKITL
ncbi:site-specific integrase [Flavobacterium sp.]|uniref:site-specific integrase n=1 Tax=Flavobacterium sp. TaxID=239 RepID=UPI003BD97206